MISITILAISFLLVFLQIFLYFILVDKKKVEELKNELEEIREKMIKMQKLGINEKVEELIERMLEINKKVLKETFKVSIITIAIFFMVFPLLKMFFGEAKIPIPLALPIIGNKISWVYWYIICMMFVSFFLKKVFGIKFF